MLRNILGPTTIKSAIPTHGDRYCMGDRCICADAASCRIVAIQSPEITPCWDVDIFLRRAWPVYQTTSASKRGGPKLTISCVLLLRSCKTLNGRIYCHVASHAMALFLVVEEKWPC